SCLLSLFFFSSRRRHTRFSRDWSSDVCSSDLAKEFLVDAIEIVFPDDRLHLRHHALILLLHQLRIAVTGMRIMIELVDLRLHPKLLIVVRRKRTIDALGYVEEGVGFWGGSHRTKLGRCWEL